MLGGVADWLDYLLPGLEAAGWHCTLGLVSGNLHNAQNYLDRHPWREVVCIDNPTGSPQGRINALTDTIRNTLPDLVAVVNIAAAYTAVRTMRLRGQSTPKVAMTLHGLQSDLLGDVRAEADVLDAVVATNRLAVKMAAENIGNEARVLYASYGVPAQKDGAVAGINRVPGAPLKLFYCGRFEQQQKRILDLVELARLLDESGVAFQIALAGGGPDEAVLRREIEDSGCERRFVFLGVLSPTELAFEYRRHDALLITSVWETGPIVAWEAMSHGLPVITSRYVGCGLEGALVHGQNCLLFPVGDMPAAVDAVHTLASPGVAAQLRQAGFELIRKRYSQAASVGLWNDALHNILSLPALPKPRILLAPHPDGRLDKWLGRQRGEALRRILGVTYRHDDPGGEWPHANQGHESEEMFLTKARAMDRYV